MLGVTHPATDAGSQTLKLPLKLVAPAAVVFLMMSCCPIAGARGKGETIPGWVAPVRIQVTTLDVRLQLAMARGMTGAVVAFELKGPSPNICCAPLTPSYCAWKN